MLGSVLYSQGLGGRAGVEGRTIGDSVTACCKSNNARVPFPSAGHHPHHLQRQQLFHDPPRPSLDFFTSPQFGADSSNVTLRRGHSETGDTT